MAKDRCPICLELVNGEAYLDRCFHKFCYPCILQWSEVFQTKNISSVLECPLCKTHYSSIVHDFVGSSYQRHYVCDTLKPKKRFSASEAHSRRLEVYLQGSAGVGESSFRAYANGDSGRWMAAWIRRELQALMQEEDVDTVVHHVVGIIDSLRKREKTPSTLSQLVRNNQLDSASILNAVKPFIFNHSEKFVDELKKFLASGLEISAYDNIDCQSNESPKTGLEILDEDIDGHERFHNLTEAVHSEDYLTENMGSPKSSFVERDKSDSVERKKSSSKKMKKKKKVSKKSKVRKRRKCSYDSDASSGSCCSTCCSDSSCEYGRRRSRKGRKLRSTKESKKSGKSSHKKRKTTDDDELIERKSKRRKHQRRKKSTDNTTSVENIPEPTSGDKEQVHLDEKKEEEIIPKISSSVAEDEELKAKMLEIQLRQKALQNFMKYLGGDEVKATAPTATSVAVQNAQRRTGRDVGEKLAGKVDVEADGDVHTHSSIVREFGKQHETAQVTEDTAAAVAVSLTDASTAAATAATIATEAGTSTNKNSVPTADKFEQKTLSVVRAGERVQVSYKVYIPQRSGSLENRRKFHRK